MGKDGRNGIYFLMAAVLIASKYVQQGNTESINIANVTTLVATRPDQPLDGVYFRQ